MEFARFNKFIVLVLIIFSLFHLALTIASPSLCTELTIKLHSSINNELHFDLFSQTPLEKSDHMFFLSAVPVGHIYIG